MKMRGEKLRQKSLKNLRVKAEEKAEEREEPVLKAKVEVGEEDIRPRKQLQTRLKRIEGRKMPWTSKTVNVQSLVWMMRTQEKARPRRTVFRLNLEV